MLFLENLIRALLIFNELRNRHCQRALLGYHYPQETGRSLALALGVCERCMNQPDWWARLDERYRLRYGFDRDGRVVVRRNSL
jgi:hypothetical protein